MGWINIAIDILLFLFVIDCVLMCLVVLMQRSKQEGLGAAFGGGFTESVWGAQTSQVLVKLTCILAAGFFLISISLAKLYSVRAAGMEKGSPLQQELLKPVAPLSTNSASTTTAVPTISTTNAAPASAMAPTPVVPEKPAAK